MTQKICKLKKEDCIKSFECEWIVGKGCKPRENAKAPSAEKLNFTALPLDVKKLIIAKLSAKNATGLRLTDKENYKLIDSVKFTNNDYLELGLKPFTARVLKILEKYGKTFRKDVIATPRRFGELPTSSEAMEKIKTSNILNLDDNKFDIISIAMKKDPTIFRTALKKNIIRGLELSTLRNQHYFIFHDVKSARNTEQLIDIVINTVGKNYDESYWYAATRK